MRKKRKDWSEISEITQVSTEFSQRLQTHSESGISKLTVKV